MLVFSLVSVKVVWRERDLQPFGMIRVTLKAPITTAADDIHKYFFIVLQRKSDLIFQVNTLNIKHQALLSSKDKSKKIKVSSAAIFVRRF